MSRKSLNVIRKMLNVMAAIILWIDSSLGQSRFECATLAVVLDPEMSAVVCFYVLWDRWSLPPSGNSPHSRRWWPHCFPFPRNIRLKKIRNMLKITEKSTSIWILVLSLPLKSSAPVALTRTFTWLTGKKPDCPLQVPRYQSLSTCSTMDTMSPVRRLSSSALSRDQAWQSFPFLSLPLGGGSWEHLESQLKRS